MNSSLFYLEVCQELSPPQKVSEVLFVTHSGEELLLASCSQDCLIRVWRLCAKSGTDTHTEDDHTVIRMKEDVFEVTEAGELSRLQTLGKFVHKLQQNKTSNVDSN